MTVHLSAAGEGLIATESVCNLGQQSRGLRPQYYSERLEEDTSPEASHPVAKAPCPCPVDLLEEEGFDVNVFIIFCSATLPPVARQRRVFGVVSLQS